MNAQDQKSNFPHSLDKTLFKSIPICNLSEKTDFTHFNEYLLEQEGDYINGIFYMLQKNNFERPIERKTNKTQFDTLFQNFFDDVNRRVVYFSHPQTSGPFFTMKPSWNVYSYFRPLVQPKPIQSKRKISIGRFAANPQNFYIYCCHFFRKMIVNSFSPIDLNQWCLSSEIPSAPKVISDAIFDAADVQSYFEPELRCLFMIISKLPYRPLPDKNLKPYIFENGLLAEINHDKNFSYRLKLRNFFDIESTKNSIKFQPNESFCVHFNYPFGCDVIFNQSMLFDGKKIILMENEGKISYITTDGTFFTQIKCPTAVSPNGTISQKIDLNWVSVTSDSVTYINRKKVDRKSSCTVDYKTGTKSMIRPDGIEYYICSDGKRRILFNNGISIEQKNGEYFVYDIPNFPLITLKKGQFHIQMNNYKLTFSSSEKVSIDCDLFSVLFDGKKVKLNWDDYNAELSNTECKIESPFSILYSNSEAPEDKFESQISQADIQKKFPIRFFAIRSNLTGVEFVMKDSQLLKDAFFRTSKVPHPCGNPVIVLESLFQSIEKVPFIFIENFPIKYPDDENELNNILNGNDEEIEIESDRESFINDSLSFSKLLDNYLDSEDDTFQSKQSDINILDENINWPAPFNTPSPRIQNMQYSIHQTNIKDLKNGEVLNYFKSHEADFVIIDNDYEIVEEEEEEEEDNVISVVNHQLKQYEISGTEIDYTGQNIVDDLPPPSFLFDNGNK